VPAETPPSDRHSLSPFLTTAAAVEVLNRLERGLGARKPLLVLTGAPGLGKSTLAREAVRRWDERVSAHTVLGAELTAASLAATLLAGFGGAPKPDTHPLAMHERLLETLANATSGGRVAVLVVDEADALADDVLLELVRLALRATQRQCPLELLLVGSPALAERLESPALAEARAELSTLVALAPLSAHDARHYLLQRGAGAASFSRKACRDLHAASRGIMRDLEALAAEAARRAARSNAGTISPEHVRAAVNAVRSRRTSTPAPGRPAGAQATKPVAEPADVPAAAAIEAEAPASEDREPGSADTGEPAPAPEVAAPVSNDPRVRDWVNRFGGAGVRIGGSYVPRSASELEFPETTVADEAREPAPWHAQSGAVTRSFVPEDPAEPVAWPRTQPRRGPVLGRRRDSSTVWQATTVVLAVALGALIIGQRGLLPRAPESVTALETPPADSLHEDARQEQGSARPKRGARRNSPRLANRGTDGSVSMRYAVAVGTYLDADQARAERDHLARLISYRVWVNTSNVGGVKTFRLQFGMFTSVEQAEEAAQKLLRRGLLRDANVVEVPVVD